MGAWRDPSGRLLSWHTSTRHPAGELLVEAGSPPGIPPDDGVVLDVQSGRAHGAWVYLTRAQAAELADVLAEMTTQPDPDTAA